MHIHRLLCPLAAGLLALAATPADAQSPPPSSHAPADVYIVPFSHLDLFWGCTREECLARGNDVIAKALRIADDHPEFRYFLESDNFVANYVETHRGTRELDDLRQLVRQGRFEIAPNWADIFLSMPDGEVLARNLLYGTRYARSTFGVTPQVFHPGDIPGFPPQLPQMLAESRIPYMVMTRLGPTDRSLFDWQSPNASKVLVWNAIRGYDWGTRLRLENSLTDSMRVGVRRDVDDIRRTTAGPIFIHWGLDLWSPSPGLVSNVPRLDRDIAGAHFTLATPEGFFRAAQSAPRRTITGEIPLGWPHVLDGIVHLWQWSVPATNTLENAERFAAVNYALGYADYPGSELELLWKRLLESMDHNHDGQGGDIGDGRKLEYSRVVIDRGGEILRDMLRNIAERVRNPVKGSFPIVVFNALGWRRDDLVRAHVTLFGDPSPGDLGDFRKGIRVVDESGGPVPFHVTQTSENISRALEFEFVARDVPSLGYRTYFVVPADHPDSFPAASKLSLDSDKLRVEPRRAPGYDVAENEFYRVTIDKAAGRLTIFDKHLGRDVMKDAGIVAVEERGTNNVQREILTGRSIPMSIDGTTIEENSAIRTVIRIPGWIADIPVTQRVILYRDLKRVDLENTIDWREHRALAIQLLIPVAHPGAKIEYGVAFGASSPENVLPSSGPRAGDEIQRDAWQKYRTIQDWVFAGDSDWGVTLAADHQLVQLDGDTIHAQMIRGQPYTSARITRGDTVTSIRFPAPGRYVFRYSLTSGAGDWKRQRSYRIGSSFNNGLMPVSVVDNVSSKSLPATASFVSLGADDVVLSALKKAEDDTALVLRVYEGDGSAAEAPVTWLGSRAAVRETDLLEQDAGSAAQAVIRFKPFQIRTVKLSVERNAADQGRGTSR